MLPGICLDEDLSLLPYLEWSFLSHALNGRWQAPLTSNNKNYCGLGYEIWQNCSRIFYMHIEGLKFSMRPKKFLFHFRHACVQFLYACYEYVVDEYVQQHSYRSQKKSGNKNSDYH